MIGFLKACLKLLKMGEFLTWFNRGSKKETCHNERHPNLMRMGRGKGT